MNEFPQPHPMFDDGEEFLYRLRHTIKRRNRKAAYAGSLLSVLAAAFIYIGAFHALERQVLEEEWQQYLLSQLEEQLSNEELEEFPESLYLEALIEQDELDVLLEVALEKVDGNDWLKHLDLKG